LFRALWICCYSRSWRSSRSTVGRLAQRLKQVSGDVLQVSDGSLYPASQKLEQQGWISAEWKASENNRRAKFYSLTRLGSKHLGQETANGNRLAAAISNVV
jgi:PadR family transcriptional regulator, regulatory protein PadR